MFKGCLAYIEPRAYVICSLLIHLSRARARDFLFSEIMKGTGGREDGGPGGGGRVAGLNRVYLAAGWLHFCIQVVLVLSTTDHATTQVM